MDPVIAEQLSRDHPLAVHLEDPQEHGRFAATLRAYRGALLQFTAH